MTGGKFIQRGRLFRNDRSRTNLILRSSVLFPVDNLPFAANEIVKLFEDINKLVSFIAAIFIPD